MTGSRWQRWRRISQIFFLLLFLALLVFTSLRAMPGATSDIHLRAPVRLFFEWDPLVAVANALAGHALYRGLLWSLVILVPTLFLGRFFCGWICPMGTLQHFVGNMPSETKRGKQRIESNRYKRWQTIKYVVLIAGLVAACLRVDGDWLARSLQPAGALYWACRFCPRSTSPCAPCWRRLSTATSPRSKRPARRHSAVLQVFGARFPPGALCAGTGARHSVSRHSAGQPARHALLVPLDLSAGRAAGRGLALVASSACTRMPASCDNCNRCLLHCQGGDDPIGGAPWRKSECLMCMNCVGSCPHDQPRIPLLPQRERSGLARSRPPQDDHGPGGRRGSRAADARQHRHGQEPPRAAAASARRAR